MPVVITFVRALTGTTLFTKKLDLSKDSDVVILFYLVRSHPAADGNSFCLKVRKQVWKDDVDADVKVLRTTTVQDALGVSEGGDVQLRIEVIFVPKQQTSSASSG